jgi:hypothetical protein
MRTARERVTTLLIDGEPHPDDFSCQIIGLAIDSNSGKGGPDRDGCAAVIFALTMPGLLQGSLRGAGVVPLDWDIQSLAQGGVAPWLTHMRERTMMWFRLEAARRAADAAYRASRQWLCGDRSGGDSRTQPARD